MTDTVKTMYDFQTEIKSLIVEDGIFDLEMENQELNDFSGYYSFGGSQDIEDTINDNILYNLDFFSVDYVVGGGAYYCGFLTQEPFCDLNKSEEEILNMIVENHIKSVNFSLQFVYNDKSPLHEFFMENSDGYGGNIEYSINVLMSFLAKYIKKQFAKNMENWASWTDVPEFDEDEDEDEDEEIEDEE